MGLALLNASVSVRGLNVRVGSTKILDNLCFTLEHGTIALVVGPSGSGKSTLLKVLSGLIPEVYNLYEVSGDVRVYGLKPSKALRAGLISYVPQDLQGFFLSSNVCDELKLSGVPVGEYVGVCSRRISSLSDGELYKLLTYISLESNAKLILIDEPSSHLDSSALTELLEELRDLCRRHDATVILADHNVSQFLNYVDVLVKLGDDVNYGLRLNSHFVMEKAVGDYVLVANGVSFGYENNKVIFDNLDLTLREGESLCIYGRNGVGKTTLLKVLIGMLKPRCGYLYVRKPLFYLPQRPVYWFASGRVHDELMLYLRLYKKHIELGEILRRFKLVDLLNRDPYTLSVGEARRLSLALAYISSAKLVLLDEPTIGLDKYSEDLLVDLIREFNYDEKRGVVLTSHDQRIYRECDYVIRLS